MGVYWPNMARGLVEFGQVVGCKRGVRTGWLVFGCGWVEGNTERRRGELANVAEARANPFLGERG